MAVCLICSEQISSDTSFCRECNLLVTSTRSVPTPTTLDEFDVWLHYQIEALKRSARIPDNKVEEFWRVMWLNSIPSEVSFSAKNALGEEQWSRSFSIEKPEVPRLDRNILPFTVKGGKYSLVIDHAYELLFRGTLKQCELYKTWLRIVAYPRNLKLASRSGEVKILNQKRYERLTGMTIRINEENESQKREIVIGTLLEQLETVRQRIFALPELERENASSSSASSTSEREFVWVTRGDKQVCPICKENDWLIKQYRLFSRPSGSLNDISAILSCEHECRCVLVPLDALP